VAQSFRNHFGALGFQRLELLVSVIMSHTNVRHQWFNSDNHSFTLYINLEAVQG
jgi:hypothetical protein